MMTAPADRDILFMREALAEARLAAHPALQPAASDENLAELERRTGRRVVLRWDPALAPDAPHAQFVADG